MKKQKLNTPNYLLAWFFMILGAGCASKKSTAIPLNKIESTSKIIFLNYTIKKTPNDTREVRFINKTMSDGKLKNHHNESIETGVSGDLICFQLDENLNVLQRFLIKNPLSKSIEYLDASKSFQRKHIDLDSTQFSIRLQLKSGAKHISISDFSTFENQVKPLVKTPIY